STLALRATRAQNAAGVGVSGPVVSAGAMPAPVKQPRMGVFEQWGGGMDAGWTRWVLEQYGFPFVTIRPEDFKNPLADRIDVLIMADDARVPMAPGTGVSMPPAAGRGGGAARA